MCFITNKNFPFSRAQNFKLHRNKVIEGAPDEFKENLARKFDDEYKNAEEDFNFW